MNGTEQEPTPEKALAMASSTREFHLPILPSTQLCLELALSRHAPELGQLAAILRSDPVAVLQIFRLTAHGFAHDGESFGLEARIASFGPTALSQAFLARAPARGGQSEVAAAFAQQARATAQMCRALAEALGLCVEKAYLIGLLHAAASLSMQLEHHASERTSSGAESALRRICEQYELPCWLARAMGEVQRGDTSSPWTAMVRAAYDLLGLPPQQPLLPPERTPTRLNGS